MPLRGAELEAARSARSWRLAVCSGQQSSPTTEDCLPTTPPLPFSLRALCVLCG